jgi:hypothetical protein
MIKSILAAILVFGFAATAHAAPVAKPSASSNISASSDLVEIKKYYKRKGKYRGPKYRGRGYYRGGYGRNYYRTAPRGWRSYSYRPFGWQRRGCIIAGPVWYCP